MTPRHDHGLDNDATRRAPETTSTSGEDGESEFSRVLVEHGLSEAAAAEVAGYSEALRRMTAAEGVEFAGMVDAETGQRLGRTIRGEEAVTDIRAHIDAMQPGCRYVQVHTHPRNTPFSRQDGRLLVRVVGLHSMVLTGVDGTRFILSKNPEVPEEPEGYRRAFDTRLVRTWGEMIGRPAGDMTPDEFTAAMAMVLGPVWEQVAPIVGLRYARVRGL